MRVAPIRPTWRAATAMSAEPPSPWEQACPRSVRLAPDGFLVPAATLRVMLRGGRRLPLLYTGHAFAPWLRDGDVVVVSSGGVPRRGDLLLCDVGGWGDLLRAVRPAPGGDWVAALDAFPRRRVTIPAGSILGSLEPDSRSVRWRTAERLWHASGLGAASFAWRRIALAPRWTGDPRDSVLEKYRSQVAAYRDSGNSNLTPEHLDVVARHARPGGDVLVCGCGAGGEAVHLARLGYKVTAFDALPEMIEAARQAAGAAGVTMSLLTRDLLAPGLGEERFGVIYMTPLLYSFVPGRARRVATLRRLAAHLAPGGCVLLSVQLYRGPWSWIQPRLAHAVRLLRRDAGEAGDWYTSYLTPAGTIGTSFLRRFAAGEVIGEARAAGYADVVRLGSHFVAAGAPTA
jgi:SAM-dependent methyltransferase